MTLGYLLHRKVLKISATLVVILFVSGLMGPWLWAVVPAQADIVDPYFSNITSEVELDGVSGFRVSIADVDGDGYPDLLLHQTPDEVRGEKPCHKDPSKEPYTCKDQVLYLNVQGDNPNDPYSRKFIDYTEESGIRISRRGIDDRRSNLAVFADVDNDGDLDMFSGVYGGDELHNYEDNGDRNGLFLNDGSGHFTMLQNTPFYNEDFWNTTSATFLDYNQDGNIDLFVGNYFTDYKRSYFKDQLYRGNGNGSFENVTTSVDLDLVLPGQFQPTMAVTTADTNNDGFMDLFASNYCRDHSIHWQNNGNGTFTQIQESTDYGKYIAVDGALHWPPSTYYNTCSWGSMPRDFDNDGDIDFFEIITHGSEDGNGKHSTVLVNENNIFSWDFNRMYGRANDDPNISHHGDHYASWFDINNDGLSDFILTESGYANDRLYLFKQAENSTFYLVTSEAGLDSVNADSPPTHNVTPFDYDLDGDEDLLIGFGGKDGVQLWRNDVGAMNNWITITLKGTGIPGHSNISAIGARVEVTAGSKTYTREVYAGNGHFGPQAPLSLTFGLGQATKVDTIKVYWPNDNLTFTNIDNLAVNQFISIRESYFYVNRYDDPKPRPDVNCATGGCSLREAIIAANTIPGPNIINLKAGTYHLSIAGVGEEAAKEGDLDINDDLLIQGAGAFETIIDGGRLDRVFHVHSNTNVTFEDLKIQNGKEPQDGGGIFNSGRLVKVVNSILANNSADRNGGGIFNAQNKTLLISYSNLSDNEANSGGGIYNKGVLDIKYSSLSFNDANNNGGGIFSDSGLMSLTNTTLARNRADNYGGGLYLEAGTVVFVPEIYNSTFGNNTAGAQGDNIYNVGLYPIAIANSIIAVESFVNNQAGQNCAPANHAYLYGTTPVFSKGNNLGTDKTCGLIESTDIIGDPRFGFFTQTASQAVVAPPGRDHFQILSDSPVIDAGNDSLCQEKDQLGRSRVDGNGDGVSRCDIGANEYYPIVNEMFPKLTPGSPEVQFTCNSIKVPGGPEGTCTITATFENKSSQSINNLFFDVIALDHGNLLLNADGGPGSLFATLTPLLNDGELPGGESMTVDFVIGLQKLSPFRFFVDIRGEPRP